MAIARKSKWRRGIWLLLPLALFFAAREKASWRPQRMMQLKLILDEYIVISSDERLIAYFEPKHNRQLATDAELPVVVRDLQSGDKRGRKMRGAYPSIKTAAFDKNARRLAIGWRELDGDGATHRMGIAVWSFGDKLRDFEIIENVYPIDYPTQSRFSPDGKTLWMASANNLYSWDIASGKLKKLKWQWGKEGLERNGIWPSISAISEDCRYYFRVDLYSGYAVWDIAKDKFLLSTKLPELIKLDFSPDAELMVAIKGNKAVPDEGIASVLDSMTGRVLWQSPAGTQLTLSNRLAIVKNKNRFEVRETRTGKFLRWLPAIGNVRVIQSESADWLYTVNDRNELFRQRLR